MFDTTSVWSHGVFISTRYLRYIFTDSTQMIPGYMYVLHTLARHGEHININMTTDMHKQGSDEGRGEESTALVVGGNNCTKQNQPTAGPNTKNRPVTMGEFTDMTGSGRGGGAEEEEEEEVKEGKRGEQRG